jgi:hypothetical protein
VSDVGPERDRSGESGEVARLVAYVALFAVSAALFLEAAGLPVSRFERLGAGAFPMIVHGTLMALLLGAIVATIRRLPRAAYARFAADVRDWAVARRLVFFLFACLGLYLAVMPVVGFAPATFVFLAVMQGVLAPKTPVALGTTLVLALVFSYGLNWLFAEVFNVFLPRGR